MKTATDAAALLGLLLILPVMCAAWLFHLLRLRSLTGADRAMQDLLDL